MTKFYAPSLPLANFTCVGFSAARKALNIWVLLLRSLKERKRPRPRPMREPMVACVPILLPALINVSRSESCRSCLKCSSASLPMSSPAFLRRTAKESADIAVWYQSVFVLFRQSDRAVVKVDDGIKINGSVRIDLCTFASDVTRRESFLR